MTDTIRPDHLRDPADAAAYWLMRAQSGSMDEAERQHLQAWLDADPRHALEYRRAQGAWNAVALVPAERLRQLARPEHATSPVTAAPSPQTIAQPIFQPAHRPPARTRRWWLASGGSAATAAIAAAFLLPRIWHDPARYAAQYASGAGQQPSHTLPDGSSIALNVATALSVEYTRNNRNVQLAAGEAVFTVVPDAQRPFTVTLGDVQVRVTGTRFAVRRDAAGAATGASGGPEKIEVLVESGSVELRQGARQLRTVAQLVAGDRARYDGSGPWRIRQGSDVESALAWRQGRLVFRDTPLAEAVAELNRYAPQPIRLADATLGQVRIAGVFSTDDTAAFLQLLPDIVGSAQVRMEPDGSATILRRF